MGMAIKSSCGNLGFDIWKFWSQRSDTYNDKDSQYAWKSFRPEGKVTIASLFYEAKANGWRDDMAARMPTSVAFSERQPIAAKNPSQELGRSQAASKATEIARSSSAASDDHPYLIRKQIKAHGAMLCRGSLAIPMSEGGKLHSLQFIDAEGNKRFLSNGRAAGCHFVIGKQEGATTICISEGFATGATIHEATGYPVIVAFTAGNLLGVATGSRAEYPDVNLVICGDDDHRTAGNPGIEKATAAAIAVGGLLALPTFGTQRPDGATDFNDMAVLLGKDAVQKAIVCATAPTRSTDQSTSGSLFATDLSDRAWSAPQPIPCSLRPVESFDNRLLPAAIRAWVMDIAERMQCPADFTGVGAMVALSSVIGRKAGIRPKREDDWLVIPNLWGAVVGRPGVMKSPALSEVMKPLDHLATQANERHAESEREHEIKSKLKLMGDKASEAKAQKMVSAGKLDQAMQLLTEAAETASSKPVLRRYKVTDASVESLGEILIENPWGTLAFRDELNGLLRSLDKEGQEGARSFYLQGYDGNQSYTFDRIVRGRNLHIPAVCIAMLGGIQPGRLQAYIHDAVSGGAGDDGLLQRFGMLVWPDVDKEWINVDRWPDTPARRSAYETFERLDSLKPGVDPETGEESPIPYRFCIEAQELFEVWRQDLEISLRSGKNIPAMESHLSKYRKLVPAIALICALADGETEVSSESLLKALAWSEYLETHAARAYTAGSRPSTETASILLGKIKSGMVSNPFSAREIYLKGWARLDTPDAVHSAAAILCDLNHLRRNESDHGRKGGRPATTYAINPRTVTGQ